MSTGLHAAGHEDLREVIQDYLEAAKHDYRTRGTDRDRQFVDVLKMQFLITDNLTRLTNKLQSHQDGNGETEVLLADLQHGAAGVLEWTIDKLQWDPLLTLPSQTSAVKAQQVFDTTELAEMILSLLPTADILHAASANKALAHCISSSNKLHEILCLRPDPESFWRSNFKEHGKFEYLVECVTKYPFKTNWNMREEIGVEVHIFRPRRRAYFGKEGPKSLPPAGSRCQSMLICQPPIKEMSAVPNCCGNFWIRCRRYGDRLDNSLPPPPESSSIRSETGLTLGDLVQFAEKTSKEHRLCPYGFWRQHNEVTGELNPQITFKGTMRLRPDDPALPPDNFSGYSSPEIGSSYSEDMRKQDGLTELDAYIEVKKWSLKEGLPIPTMAGWRYGYDHDSDEQPEYRDLRSQTLPIQNYRDYSEGDEAHDDNSNDMAWPNYYDTNHDATSNFGDDERTDLNGSNEMAETTYDGVMWPSSFGMNPYDSYGMAQPNYHRSLEKGYSEVDMTGTIVSDEADLSDGDTHYKDRDEPRVDTHPRLFYDDIDSIATASGR